MGNAFLHGQGGSGGAKKIKGWVTKNISHSFEANTGSTPVLVDSIALDGEIATIRMLVNMTDWFFDYVNGYYLSGYSRLANVSRNALSEDKMIQIYSSSGVELYVKKNGKNLEVYAANTSSEASTLTGRSMEIGYL